MASTLRMAALFIALAAWTPAFSQEICDCVNTGNCPVPIVDNGSYDGTLNVTVNGVNDLAVNPITEVCFTITHTWIGDLSVSLTSPSGVNYLLLADENNNWGGCGMQEDNIDICIVPGDFAPCTNNSQYQCNTGPCPAGTCCLTGNVTVACGGVIDPINNATQAPNCDLDDFNVPGDPANGTWTLTVVDVCNMDTGTLDNFSLTFANGVETCIACEADAGILDSTDIVGCVGSPALNLSFPPDYGSSLPPPDSIYSYGYIISQNGVVMEIDSLANLMNQPAGTYQVYGLSYFSTDSSNLSVLIGLETDTVIMQLASTVAPLCGALSSNWVNVTIEPAPAITFLNEEVCAGDCIMVGSQTICVDSTVTLTSWLGCDSIVEVNLTSIFPDTTAQNATVCEGGCVDIGGTQYCAPGPYFISLNTFQGCDSVVHLTFNEILVNAIIDPAIPPTLTCQIASTLLDGSGSVGAQFSWSGPSGFIGNLSWITATEPGLYTLTVSDNSITPACESSTSITVGDGIVDPDLIVVGAAPEICAGDSFDLSSLTVQDQNGTNPSITFHSATPADALNELAVSLVMPTSTSTYYILGTNGVCNNETSIVLTVNNLATADFSASGNICVIDEATITYSGNGSAGATYTWDFDGGTAVPGTGPGPHQVTWPADGTYTVSLTVTENGCESAAFTQDVDVEAPLSAPLISCAGTTSSIEFSWNEVAGNNGYQINVLYGPAGTVGSTANSQLFDGLTPGDSVTIEIVAIGTGACGNSQSMLTCYAQDCPGVTLTVTPVADICLEAISAPFNLNATASGGNGGGTYTWSGNGVTADGTFDPNQAAINGNTITLTYQEDNCVYTESLNINVFQTPTASINLPVSTCEEETVSIEFSGIAEAGSIFTWDLGSADILSGSGEGPIDVSWPDAGSYDVSLIVESPNGCASEMISETIFVDSQVEEPSISCSSTTSSVVFSWNDVSGASDYIVNFTTLHTGTQLNNTTWEVTGLAPGDQVDIEIETIASNLCGNNVVQSSCTATDCPNVLISIDPVSDICLDASTLPFDLAANVTGNTPDGILIWTGNGVSPSGNFDPSQADLGANLITLSYEESTCFYSEIININVFKTPTANFTGNTIACAGEDITFTYAAASDPGLIYLWDFDGGNTVDGTGEGPHDVSWPSGGNYTVSLNVQNAEGCISETITMDVTIEDPLQIPVINCSTTTNSIVFSWNDVGAVGQTIAIAQPYNGIETGTSYTLDGLPPSTAIDFELTILGSGACPPSIVTASCSTDACPQISVDLEEVTDFCLGNAAPVQLQVTETGSDGTGIGTWSGNGVNAAGIFDPNAVTFGPQTISYSFEEAACTFVDQIVINVYQQPSADFSADAVICIDDASSVSFGGTAGPNANFIWDFNGGTAIPGTGPGPHQVTWDTPGDKTITLNIEENGCAAAPFNQVVQVDEKLNLPSLSCSSTTESVEFIWPAISGATGYEIEVLSPPSNPQTIIANSYLISGLNPGEEVIFQVTPIGTTTCPIQASTITCSSQECWDVAVEILPVDPVCLDGTSEQTILQANIDGAPSAGTGFWSGNGIIDATQGIFDPITAGAGVHTITYEYQIVNCIYIAETTIKIGLPPIADAGTDASMPCWESENEVRLGGINTSIGQTIVYEWVSNSSSLPDNPSIANPLVTEAGTYTLIVTDVELGCSSSDEIVISTNQDLPYPSISMSMGDCSGQNATLTIDQVNGGQGPYLFSLNNSPFIETDTFPFLPAGEYDLSVIDAGGCVNDTAFVIEETAGQLNINLTANLVGRNAIEEGESIQLIALLGVPVDQLDSLVWTNADFLSCTNCLDPEASPTETTTFNVTAYYNGCETSDELTIYVEFINPVYVPTAFSPNRDNQNDIFQLYPGNRVSNVKSFMIFDRWGEMVCSHENYAPEEAEKNGWDGSLDGKDMRPGVFVWVAEIEFVDGVTEVFKGEVALIR